MVLESQVAAALERGGGNVSQAKGNGRGQGQGQGEGEGVRGTWIVVGGKSSQFDF